MSGRKSYDINMRIKAEMLTMTWIKWTSRQGKTELLITDRLKSTNAIEKRNSNKSQFQFEFSSSRDKWKDKMGRWTERRLTHWRHDGEFYVWLWESIQIARGPWQAMARAATE